MSDGDAARSRRLRTGAHAVWRSAATRSAGHAHLEFARVPEAGLMLRGHHCEPLASPAMEDAGGFTHARAPSRRAVRGSMSKRDRFFDRLERRVPKKRCRRCRQKFTPPTGYTSLICPRCRRIEKAG